MSDSKEECKRLQVDTRVSVCLTPGCQHTQHPGVGMSETRVSDNLVLLTKIKVKLYYLICIRTNQIYVSTKWDFQLVLFYSATITLMS